MHTSQKLSELELRRAIIQNTAKDRESNSQVENKLTARARIAQLLDASSFVELGAFMTSRREVFQTSMSETPADGVVCGYGTINGQLVYVYSQDRNVLGGAIGEIHAQKIVKVYDEAMKVGAPVIGFIETVGLRLQESIDALQGYGMIFKKISEVSGSIPIISVICGPCAGGASFIPGLSDFNFILMEHAKMYLNSPNTMNQENVTFDCIATSNVHLEQSGLATIGASTEEQLIAQVIELMNYLPLNSKEDTPCYTCKDDLNRINLELNTFDFVEGTTKDIIKKIADDYTYFELWEHYGSDITLGFIRLNGVTVGVIGNQMMAMDYSAILKVTQFVKFCDTFNIAIVTFTNIKHIQSTKETEERGIIRVTSQMIKAFARSTVPKVNVILNAAYGMGYLAMNSKAIGADCVYAWPTAETKIMDTQSAVKIMYNQEIEQAQNPLAFIEEKAQLFEQINSIYGMASRGYVDDLIEPAETRKRVIAVLENLIAKKSRIIKNDGIR